jgi:hypothetical protein
MEGTTLNSIAATKTTTNDVIANLIASLLSQILLHRHDMPQIDCGSQPNGSVS